MREEGDREQQSNDDHRRAGLNIMMNDNYSSDDDVPIRLPLIIQPPLSIGSTLVLFHVVYILPSLKTERNTGNQRKYFLFCSSFLFPM